MHLCLTYISESDEFWTSPALTRANRKGTVLHQVKYVVDVVMQPEEGGKNKHHREADKK